MNQISHNQLRKKTLKSDAEYMEYTRQNFGRTGRRSSFTVHENTENEIQETITVTKNKKICGVHSQKFVQSKH